MMVDNADDATVFKNKVAEAIQDTVSQSTTLPSLESFTPQTQHGRVIFTSRSEDVASWLTGGHKNIIRIEPMNPEEGLDLFKSKVTSRYTEESMTSLLGALEYMPLAISQAAAYINRLGSRGSIPKYLEQFHRSENSRASLLEREASDIRRDADARHSIIVTWQISFDQIRHERPSAAELLSLMSFFDRQGIPDFVLQNCSNSQHVDGGADLDPDMEFDQDLAVLQSYCLIKTGINGDVFQMHRLVQFATRKWLEAYDDLNLWRRRYMRCLSKEYPMGEFEQWSRCEILFPHAVVATVNEPNDEDSLQHWSEILINAAQYASAQGRGEVSESMARKVVVVREKVLGKDNRGTLMTMSFLAITLLGQEKFEIAEKMIRQVLDGCRKVLGERSP